MCTITVSSSVGSNGSDFNPSGPDVRAGDSVTLVAARTTLPVYTFVKDSAGVWQQTNVFEHHSSPYNATTAGKNYKLRSSISGAVLLSLTDVGVRTGVNGTINVGGTGDPDAG